MRRMSFAMTKDRILDRTKTQTRRLGWNHLKIGDMVRPVEKSMGLRKGEKVTVLGDYDLRVTKFWKEHLNQITIDGCIKEGFPQLSPLEFVSRFCSVMECDARATVNVIEFEYVPRSIFCGEVQE